jgi:alpha-2-macroglobulin
MNATLPALAAILATTVAALAAPRLVVSTPSLAPESKIDLVLDLPVIETTEIGGTTDNRWLDVSPDLPGKLRWKAQNIAEFLPDQPPAMGITYTFSIPKGRKHLDGSAVPQGKFATVSSEEFRLVQCNPVGNRWSEDFSPSTAGWLMVFNDEIDAAAAAAFVSFANKNGQRVAATLEPVKLGQSGHYGMHTKPWNQRLQQAPSPTTADESIAPHVILARPVSPLPPAEAWQVSVLKGLPNKSATARTTGDLQYDIGRIEPFRVTDISARTEVNEPRKLVISFNHGLSKSLPEDFLSALVSITPRPEKLLATVDGRRIEITGALEDTDTFGVTMNKPFASGVGLSLQAPFTKQVKFQHLDPGLSLPSDNQAQLANGSRTYQIHALNLSKVHVRIKKLAGADLIRAYQGYRHYTGAGADGKSLSPTSPLPWPMIVGETVLDREMPLDLGVDCSRTIDLQWNELLPKDLRHAALFIDANGTAHPGTGEDGGRNAQAIVQLTDIGLAWKLTAAEALVYAFSCDTGAPLRGVKLQLFGEDAAAMQHIVTDAGGLAALPRDPNARHLLATLADDAYLTAFDSTLDTVGLWHFPVRYPWNTPAESSRQAFLFTDRSLYRPGETVRLKGIIRNLRGNTVSQESPAPARLIVRDPEGKEIVTQAITISAGGSFDFTHQLAPSKVGEHLIQLEFPDELAKLDPNEDADQNWEERERILSNARFEVPLRVEEFRRNAFEITQEIAHPAPGAAKVTAALTARYYQGQPVAAGSVKFYSQVSTSNPYPERYRDFLFGNHRSYDWGYWYHYFGYRGDDDDSPHHSSNLQGDAQLAADGTANLSIDIPQAEFPSMREVTVSTEVTDSNLQTLTSSASTVVHPASVYIGVSRIDHLVRAGGELPIRIVAIDTAEKPFNAALKLTATLTREVNQTVRTLGDNGATTTRNDVTAETVSTSEFTLDPADSAREGMEFKLAPKSTGLHFLTLRGVDQDGRAFATVTRFHAYGTNEYPWLYEDGMRVKLVAEKKSWNPGETARVLVLTPIEGTALVTVEREKVLRSFKVELKADNPVIEIPLTDDDAPNAFVSVLIVKGAKESAREHKEPQLRLGYCELLVENRRDRLAVAIDTPAESHRPGEEVTLTGMVSLADGKPAAGAEVTLYAEDEGTLAVMGYDTPDPMRFFYQPRILGVDVGTSFEGFISENPGFRDFHNKGFFVGGGGDMDALADLLRKNFDPCATWAPTLVTGADGRFSHAFKLPDTLTRYRVIAIAHHGAARFGHCESAVVAKKDLMLEPKAPRFANQTDTISPQVLVQNASRHAGTWTIAYNAHAADGTPVCRALAGTSENISLAPGASATLVFPTIAENTGEAVLTWKATPVSMQNATLTPELSRRLSDAVESRFTVQYPMPLIRQVKFVKLESGGTRDLRQTLDANLLDGMGSVDLEFSRSPLAEAAGSIEYLLQYPYGCVEQTTSSLIPWCAVDELRDVVPAFAQVPDAKIKAALQAGADRLLSMQLANGSFSYWPGSADSVDWATPYAGMGLMLAAENGAAVPQAAIDSMIQHLITSLRGMAETRTAYGMESHARALLVLAMAGKPQPAYQNAMIDRMADLTPSARAMLAAAIASADKATARQVMTVKVPLQLKHDDWMPYSPDQALQLIAWTAIDPGGPEALKTLDRMLTERNPYGHWRTTWVNGWSLVAMARYAAFDKNRGDTVAINLETNDGVQVIHLSTESPTATRSYQLGPNMKLTVGCDHSAYVRARVASKPPVAPVRPVANNGLSIDRIHQLVRPDGSTTPLTEPRPGDLIRVTLRVTLPKDDTRYLVIEDPLPAIFETVNNDFASQKSALGVQTSENDWNVSHSELRSDRAVFFLDHVWRKGTYTVSYLARCTLKGQAVSPPAKVESMYDPENFALSASRVFSAN